MMRVPKSLTKANLLPIQASGFPPSIANDFPIQASMLPQGIAKASAFQASGQNIKSVISHNDEPNDSGLTIGQQANSKQVNPRSSGSSENTGVISEPSINRIRKEAQLAAGHLLSAYTVQAVSPPIENQSEELITQATSPTALSNSPWPMAYPNAIASAVPLNPQRSLTTQAASYLNQTQAISALPLTGSIPKVSNPLPTNHLGFLNPCNRLNFQYPYLPRNTPSVARQDGMPPVPTEWPINSHVMPFFSPFRLNLAGNANRLQHLKRNHPVVERQMTEKTAPTGLFNGLHRVIQEIAKACGCCGFTEKSAVSATTRLSATRLSAQGSDANSQLLNNSGYDKPITME